MKKARRATEEPKAAGQTRNSSESSPGPGIQESAGITDAGFDLDALQVEIDKEIDSLFVSAVKPERKEGPVKTGHHEQPKSGQGDGRSNPKQPGKPAILPNPNPGRGIQESAGITGAGFDLDALQVEIDKEIDSLFVSAVKPGRNEGPVQTGNHEQPKSVQGRSPEMDEQNLQGARKAEGLYENPMQPANPQFFRIRPRRSGICRNLRRRLQSRRLSVEIDKEIDSLFVPAVKPRRNEGPVQIGHHEQTKSGAGRTTEESKAAGKTRNFPNPGPAPAFRNLRKHRRRLQSRRPSGRNR